MKEDHYIELEKSIIDSTVTRVLEIYEYIINEIESTDDGYLLPDDFYEFTRDNGVRTGSIRFSL